MITFMLCLPQPLMCMYVCAYMCAGMHVCGDLIDNVTCQSSVPVQLAF